MSDKKLTFEEANKELDQIIEKLESQNLSLDETLKMFKRADELLKFCEENFSDVEGQLLVIKNGLEEKLQKFD
ncbi:MAG: exodeoxyribonuclease VII small subunit [Clostridia bacterium]|nr:exodeoxyribonuclease VII small subunit [Clostridia bacterium]